jgi:low temperature requirement protein LtrA
LELFTDLCYVVAIAQAAAQLHHAISDGHPWQGLVFFLGAFFGTWLAWLNFAWFNSAYDPDDTTHRLLTLLQIVGSLVLAGGMTRIFHGDWTIGIAGFVIMRIGLVIMWLRAATGHPERRSTALRYAVGLVVVQSMWVTAGLVTHGHLPWWLFPIIAALDLTVPILAERSGTTPWHPHHIAERYGLFFIIVLGETVLSVSLALQAAFDESHPPTTLGLVATAGILITFSAWWLYFSREDAEVLTGNDIGMVWGLGHYFVYASTAAIGAGLAARADHHGHHSEVSGLVAAGFVTIPAAVLVVAMWLVDVRLHDRSARTALVFVLAATVIVAVTWLPGAEVWAGVLLVTLLGVEGWRHREAVSTAT